MERLHEEGFTLLQHSVDQLRPRPLLVRERGHLVLPFRALDLGDVGQHLVLPVRSGESRDAQRVGMKTGERDELPHVSQFSQIGDVRAWS